METREGVHTVGSGRVARSSSN